MIGVPKSVGIGECAQIRHLNGEAGGLNGKGGNNIKKSTSLLHFEHLFAFFTRVFDCIQYLRKVFFSSFYLFFFLCSQYTCFVG